MSTFVCVCRILSNARKRAKFAPPRPPSLAHFPHLFYNESMNTPDRNREMLALMQNLPKGTPLLLHSCCGPCSSRCLETLKETFAVTVLYYNPNITDPAEYEKRKGEQIRFLKETYWADFLDCDYTPPNFLPRQRGWKGSARAARAATNVISCGWSIPPAPQRSADLVGSAPPSPSARTKIPSGSTNSGKAFPQSTA